MSATTRAAAPVALCRAAGFAAAAFVCSMRRPHRAGAVPPAPSCTILTRHGAQAAVAAAAAAVRAPSAAAAAASSYARLCLAPAGDSSATARCSAAAWSLRISGWVQVNQPAASSSVRLNSTTRSRRATKTNQRFASAACGSSPAAGGPRRARRRDAAASSPTGCSTSLACWRMLSPSSSRASRSAPSRTVPSSCSRPPLGSSRASELSVCEPAASFAAPRFLERMSAVSHASSCRPPPQLPPPSAAAALSAAAVGRRMMQPAHGMRTAVRGVSCPAHSVRCQVPSQSAPAARARQLPSQLSLTDSDNTATVFTGSWQCQSLRCQSPRGPIEDPPTCAHGVGARAARYSRTGSRAA